jgi:hypothetical protein
MSIIEFTETNNDGNGYVVKFPFVTNSEGIEFPKSFVEVWFVINCYFSVPL